MCRGRHVSALWHALLHWRWRRQVCGGRGGLVLQADKGLEQSLLLLIKDRQVLRHHELHTLRSVVSMQCNALQCCVP
jgi:hypothetical protein